MTDKNFQFVKPGEVRVRIAPSPTGFLHIGLARTALFNYLFAKQKEGIFVLRIEDTDRERSSVEFEKEIVENLQWLGLTWDEGPWRQTERTGVYQKYLQKMLTENKAYYCFCSEEELEAQRQNQMSIGEPPRYSGKCSKLPGETAKKYLREGKPCVIRFRTPAKKVAFEDIIRGKVEFDAGLMGDIVIAKSIKEPLYNFAVVVDDYEMKVSHIIRGEEHLSNTPKQILLQEALGFSQPEYAHLPLILGTDRSKLSKRHGGASVKDYKEQGYLPEAIINFIAFLGWNPGEEREIYSLPSLVKEFNLEKVQKGGAVFNIVKLESLNGFYIRQKSIDKLTELCLPYLDKAGLVKEFVDFDALKKIVSLYRERLKKLSEIVELADFFFKEDIDYGKDLLNWKGMADKEIKASLDISEKILSKVKLEDWTKENLESCLMPEAEKLGPAPEQARYGVKDRGYLLWPLRVALTGKKASAGPFEIADILGKEKTIKRIKKAKELIK